ncbi:hypothetical protein SpAn4DRAFT_4690 [Sporomusa ovata]|uniref:Uncharacterized protein n=1 Tax=Sporomusa ovata TaxID=2378 RepID=A0A0U1KRX7_9FIRM|nr:hypothetical protein SpAn4DRAFT_4690 [Sporomusa ovata]
MFYIFLLLYKDKIFEKMSHPPSIELLAKNLCLNTHKLKLGFKVLFANTDMDICEIYNWKK